MAGMKLCGKYQKLFLRGEFNFIQEHGLMKTKVPEKYIINVNINIINLKNPWSTLLYASTRCLC